ncbi:MAG: ComEC/Rec2 family competence protein [Patescibacteria group bacterium]
MTTHNGTLFWAGAFLFLGISFASFNLSFAALFLSAAVLSGRLISREKSGWWIVLAFLACIGFFYYHAFAVFNERRELLPMGGSFTVHVSGESVILDKSQIVPFELDQPYRGRIKVFTTPVAGFSYGESVKVSGKVQNNIWPEDNVVIFPQIEKLDEPRKSVRAIIIGFKEGWLHSFRKLLSANEAALLGGLTFGARGDFTSDFKEVMKRSGTTHLIALSGYNISILIWAVERMLRSRFSRRAFFVFAIFLVALFVIMVGGGSSVTRAAIMGILVLLAKESGRFYSFWNAALFAALGMSLFNPSLPGGDIGFQLSFLSLLGIVFLEPLFKKWFGVRKQHSSFYWRESLGTTLAAQAGVFPILAIQFGVFSLTSVAANVLILWIVPSIMALGFLTAGLSMVHFSLAFLLQPFLHLTLTYMISVMNMAALLPLIALPQNIFLGVVYYGLLLWLILRNTSYEKTTS